MCNDAGSCTVDTLVSAMTCSAVCSFVPITAPASGDLCCPPGANMTTDADCLPVCGNGAVESGEACDDGNTVSDDGCSSVCAEEILATAFRFTDMDLRDPHTFISAFGCRDVTNTAFLGFSTNGELQSSIQADGDADGLLDLSPVVLFRPLDQAAVSTPMEILFADCTAPMSSTSCTRDPTATTALSNANNLAALCLDLLAGTTSIYTPAIALPSGPCFVSDATTLTIMVGGVPIVLTNAYLAATWSGTPATNLVNGLVRGFISEADADVTLLPADLPLIGGDPLSSLLPGGTGNCSTSRDDRDTGPDGSSGWYFYLNFVASARPFGG
ncbi:MAG: DUF4215 domain-containing protein [Myxococcales bacterium]|nr:DUF4215 domain-containing protein [Myxococcales bacterium]